MIISDKIFYLRKKLGYTQEELAEELNVSRQSISKWERGQSIPEISKIMDMAKLFSVSTDYLLDDEVETIDEKGRFIVEENTNNIISIEKANIFIRDYLVYIRLIATGVFISIFSVTSSILIQELLKGRMTLKTVEFISTASFFILVATAISIFIYSNSLIKKYKAITSGDFELSYNVSGIIKENKKIYMPTRTKKLIINIFLIIISPIITIIPSILNDANIAPNYANGVFLLVIGTAVYNLIISEGKKNSYDILLFEGDFNKNKIRENKKIETIKSVYWSIVIAIYLAWSFMSKDWGKTWIIWPVAALLSTALNLFGINEN